MKKYVVIALAMVWCVCSMQAQSVKIKWYPKESLGTYLSRSFMGMTEKYNYRAAVVKREMVLQKLDKDFNVISEKPFPEMEYTGTKFKAINAFSSFNVYDIVCVGGNPFVLFNAYNRETYKYEILMSKIKDDLSIESPKPILSYIMGGNDPDINVNQFRLSEDGSHIFHFYRTVKVASIIVYDKDMRKLWQTTYDLPWLENRNLKLSNDGKYVIGNGNNEIVILKESGYTTATAELEKDKTLQGVLISLDNSSNVLIAGTYAKNVYSEDEEAGAFTAKYNMATSSMGKTQYYPYDKETINKDAIKDKKIDNKAYLMLGLTQSEDGHISIISEKSYTRKKCVADNLGTHCYDEPVFAEKVVTGIGSRNEKSYELVIDSKLKLNAPAVLMDGAFQYRSKTIIIYSGGATTNENYSLAEISPNGTVTNTPLQFDEPIDLSKWDFQMEKKPDNTVFLLGKSGSNRKYGVIKLD